MIAKENLSFEREVEFFQKVDRILTGNTAITLLNIDGKNRMQRNQGISIDRIACANLHTKEIHLNFEKISKEINPSPDDKNLFLALSKGFNYHELAHIKYSRICKVLSPNTREILNILNALEDGRIETLFARRYNKARKYFELCFLNAIQREAEKLNAVTTFLSSHSRKLILPTEIITYWETAFDKAINDKDTSDKIKILIDDYMTQTTAEAQVKTAEQIFDLLYPKIKLDKNTTYALSIMKPSDLESLFDSVKRVFSDEDKEEIEQLKKALEEFNQKVKEAINEQLQKEINKNHKTAQKVNDLQKKLDEKMKKRNKTYMEAEQDNRQSVAKSNEYRETVDKRRNSANPSGSPSKKEQKLGKEVSNLRAKSKKKMDAYNKQGFEAKKIEEQLGKERQKIKHNSIKKITEQALSSTQETALDETQADAQSIYCSEASGVSAGGEEQALTKNASELIIQPKHFVISRKLQDSIRKIRNDLSKGYINGQRTGRVNIRSAMNWKQTGNTRFFERYEPDKINSTKIGIITLLDSSDSMQDIIYNKALEIAYILQDAMTKTGNPTMIIEYSEQHKIIKTFKGKPDFRRNFSNGTVPTSALLEARKQIRNYGKVEKIKNWVVFIITDGDWSDTIQAEDIIEKLNKAKVETTIINLMRNPDRKPQQHECKHQASILFSEIDDKMPVVLRDTINKIQKNIYEQIRRNGGMNQ